MSTLQELIDRTGIDVLDHLDRAELVPVVAGKAQAQGDLLVLPITPALLDAGAPVPSVGIEVIRGEAGANPHTLLGEGAVRFARGGPHALSLCVVTIDEGAVAYLAHPEHGYLGIGTGTYEVRRQREMAEVERRIAD